MTAGAGCASVGANEAFCTIPDFPDHVFVSVDDMNDYVNTSAALPGETRLEGGVGNDSLYAGEDSAVLDGGAGQTSSKASSRRWTTRRGTNPLTVTIGDGLANDAEAGENDLIGQVAAVIGGSGADTFTLTALDGRLYGEHGNDHITTNGLSPAG